MQWKVKWTIPTEWESVPGDVALRPKEKCRPRKKAVCTPPNCVRTGAPAVASVCFVSVASSMVRDQYMPLNASFLPLCRFVQLNASFLPLCRFV